MIRQNRCGKILHNKPMYESYEWNAYSRFEDYLVRTTNIIKNFHRKLQYFNYHGNHPSLFQVGKILVPFGISLMKLRDYVLYPENSERPRILDTV